jgi:hypothetical protein
MARQLTDKQQLFLAVLFEEAQGDPLQAKKLAGYSDNVATSLVTGPLEDEIADLTKKFIARSATKAAYAMSKVLQDPTAMGNKELMAAAKDLLDRGGFVKTDKIEVKAENPLFILPAKNDD